MAVLRNVPKTFSFEEQRVEINEIAQDLHVLHSAPANLTAITGAPYGTGNIIYDDLTGVLTYTPPLWDQFLEITVVGNAVGGQVIKFDGVKWTNLDDIGITLTDLSVYQHSPAGDGALGYNNSTGEFQYYPPDLSPFLTSTGSIDSHTDVSTTGSDAPTQYDTLIWDGSVWKPGLVGNVPLTNFSVTTTAASGNGALAYDTSTGVFTFTPCMVFDGDYNSLTNLPTIPAAQVNSDWTATTGVAEILNKPTFATVATTGDYNDLINPAAIPSDNSQIGNGAGYITGIGNLSINALLDVNTTGAVNGKILKYNGTNWVVGDDEEGTTISTLNDIGDVSISGTPTTGHVLKWDGSTWAPAADNDTISAGGGGTASSDPIGTIVMWSGAANAIPTGYQLCDGGASATTELQAIRANVPDLRDKFVIGAGDTYNPDATGGTADWSLPAHSHVIDAYNNTSGNDGPGILGIGNSQGLGTITTNDTGSGNGAGDNLPPYYALCYIIKNAATDGGYNDGDLDARINTPSAVSGQILSWTGTDYDWIDASGGGGGGIALTDLSVTQNAVGSASLSYDNSTGVFSYTPPDLSAVSTRGDFSVVTESASGGGALAYNSTTGVFTYTPPIIPAAQVQSDWNATSGLGEILNKPNLATVATTGSYTDLSDTPSIPAAQIQSDWDVTDSSHTAYIQNKPTVPAPQVQTDWNATTGMGEILNKPSVPSQLVDLSDVSTLTPSVGNVLKYNGTEWVADTVGGSGSTGNDSVSIGTICIWSGTVANIPTGWQICDGTNSTPDLRDRFVIGATQDESGAARTNVEGSLTQTGGSKDAVLVSHDHGGNTNSGGSHNHGMNSAGNHGHGSGQTGNQSSNHYHTFNTNNTGGHNHAWGANTFPGQVGSSFDGLDNPQNGTGGNKTANTTTEGSHSHHGTTAGVTNDHYHSFSINNGGDHTHSINNGGDHSHSINAQGDSSSNANLPPYYALCYIMKTTASGASFILSVNSNAASGGGALTYNNTTGVFDFTPADVGNIDSTHSMPPSGSYSSAHTLVLADRGKMVTMNGNSTNGGVDLHDGVFSPGDVINLWNNQNSTQFVASTSTPRVQVWYNGADTINAGIPGHTMGTLTCVAGPNLGVPSLGIVWSSLCSGTAQAGAIENVFDGDLNTWALPNGEGANGITFSPATWTASNSVTSLRIYCTRYARTNDTSGKLWVNGTDYTAGVDGNTRAWTTISETDIQTIRWDKTGADGSDSTQNSYVLVCAIEVNGDIILDASGLGDQFFLSY